MRRWSCCVLAVVACGCATDTPDRLPLLPGGAQAIGLMGDTLYPAPILPEVRATYEERLAEARLRYAEDSLDADRIIWLGRRLAYLGHYREAIDLYTRGIERHPDDPRMFRHRGHRFITIRELDRAVRDFERAAALTVGQPDEIEPDGLPNARNIPTSTLQFNIWYHLGLAHYLKRDFERALDAYRTCLERSTNPDMLVATSHWLYMTLRRLGRRGEAEDVVTSINPEMDIIENDSYHRLLLMYKGLIAPDSLLGPSDDALQSATVGYGVGNWYLYNRRPADAGIIFERVLQSEQWAAFGYLAAEAEMARAERVADAVVER